MYMSQIASSSPTPRSTSRVMMTGLIGPDLRQRTVGLVHRTTTGARLVVWNPAEKLGISHGRSSKDGTTFIAYRPRFCPPPSRPHRNQKARAEPANRRLALSGGLVAPLTDRPDPPVRGSSASDSPNRLSYGCPTTIFRDPGTDRHHLSVTLLEGRA